MTRQFISLTVSAVLAAAMATPYAQAITITEEAGSGYDLCTQTELLLFGTKITAESDSCVAKASYNWSTDFLPTTAERKELCGCTVLIKKLQSVKVPYCGFYRIKPESGGVGYYSYKDLIKYAFDGCSTSTSGSTATTTTTTTTTTTKPTATPTPFKTPSFDETLPTYTPYTFTPIATYTYSPSIDWDASNSSSSSKKSKSKVGVILGAIVGVAVVAAIIVFAVRKRNQKNDVRKSLSSSDGEMEVGVVALDMANAGDLSPLGGGGEYDTYTGMPMSPSAPNAKDMA